MANAFVYKLTGPRELTFSEEPLAPVEGNLVRATTLYSAVSPGTEVAAYNGIPPLRPMKVYPRLIGYCNIARVTEVGPEVRAVKVGDMVHSKQSHRSEFVCPETAVIVLENRYDPIHMSTTYLFHLGYSALLKGSYKPGDRVGVIGLGTLGIASVAVSSMCGANTLALSNQDSSLETVEKYSGVIGTTKNQILQRESTRDYCDLVILTSNSWDDYKLALKVADKQGRIALLGFPGREKAIPPFNPLASQYVYDKQLTVFACGYTPDIDVPSCDIQFTLKRNMQYLAGKIDSGQLDPRPLISKVVPWKKLGDVYEALSSRELGLTSAVLDWRK